MFKVLIKTGEEIKLWLYLGKSDNMLRKCISFAIKPSLAVIFTLYIYKEKEDKYDK